jgi:Fe-S-cluster containining protein
MLEALIRLDEVQKGFDGAASYLEKELKTPICTGCGKCCENNTPVSSTIEAINAVSILTGNGKLGEALKMANAWLLERDNKATSYEGLIAGSFVPAKIMDEYSNLLVSQCPFYTHEKTCFIHEVRPFACRAFGVTKSNTGFCNRPEGIGESLTKHLYVNSPDLMNVHKKLKDMCYKKNKSWMVTGLFPTLLYRAAMQKEFYELVKDNKIPSAKIIGADIDTALLWEVQKEAIDAGINPDLVACGIYKNF